ncbi:unnamed protein product [Cylicocyclus nassatus]|uniref:Uncharacterized protein n=1 Tax=Cylicocyclus nassatus TaxID=53992 RepID=A0AA36GMX9_CYLNA|nr:unnamed protein product [Cylicocyclus nassatus]
MEEDRRIKMARNVREGRHRLAEQHKRRANAIKTYCDGHVTSIVESPKSWLVCERNHTYHVKQMPCDRDEVLNNHCYNCNACGYGFKCTCLDDHTAGVSCIHVHVALVYSPQGLVTYSHMVEGEVVTATEPDGEADTPAGEADTISGTEVRDSALITDTCKELVQAITAEMAAIRMKVIGPLKEPDDDLRTQLMSMKNQLKDINNNLRYEGTTLARRLDANPSGRIPKFRGIRLIRRTAARNRRRTRKTS